MTTQYLTPTTPTPTTGDTNMPMNPTLPVTSPTNSVSPTNYATDIYIDAKQGTLPLTALYDAANNMLRMSKDGQRVIIQNHSAKGSLVVTLTRVSMGNFKEEVNFDIPPASK
jgi:hypothetical protein